VRPAAVLCVLSIVGLSCAGATSSQSSLGSIVCLRSNFREDKDRVEDIIVLL